MPLSSATTRRIDALIQKGNWAHAYLFLGSLAAFPNQAARQFAQSIHCEIRANCGKCDPCKRINANQFPDLIDWTSTENSPLKIADIRALEQHIQYGPSYSDHLTVLIPNAHRLTVSASNALLKTLESPPDRVIFCLSSTAESGVLPTINSRCLPVRCTPDPQSKPNLTELLATDLNIKQPEAIPSFLELCDASYGQRLALGHSLSTNRDTLLLVLMSWLETTREQVLTSADRSQIEKMDLLVENILNLRYNPNSRLHLDQLLLVI